MSPRDGLNLNLLASLIALRHLTQDGVENTAVAVVLDLNRRVQANLGLKRRNSSIGGFGLNAHPLQRFDLIVDGDAEGFVPSEAQRFVRFTSLKVRGSTPMPTKFDRWMRSNEVAITALTPRR